MFYWKNTGDLKYLAIEEFNSVGVKAFFTSRLGGISTGSYGQLNLGLHTGDQREAVLTNRRLIAEALGYDYRDLVAGEQIHSNRIAQVNREDRGRGALSHQDSIPGVDGLITCQKNLPLFSFYADCVPVLLADPLKGVVGLVHAGWKGTLQRIVEKALRQMEEIYHCSPRDVIAAIGPAISGDHYQVDQRVITQFRSSFQNWREFSSGDGKENYRLNLPRANQLQLLAMGIPLSQIIMSDLCTYRDNHSFFSYRRDGGITGRMASIISI
ncbi:MAG: peptidoglycan editing factor PgeF [Halanaerobiales bacterium]|nr:peptidoglycan editing factor PgeF [Halanaerobiales bacterium]